jgi:hypothetical protein
MGLPHICPNAGGVDSIASNDNRSGDPGSHHLVVTVR